MIISFFIIICLSLPFLVTSGMDRLSTVWINGMDQLAAESIYLWFLFFTFSLLQKNTTLKLFKLIIWNVSIFPNAHNFEIFPCDFKSICLQILPRLIDTAEESFSCKIIFISITVRNTGRFSLALTTSNSYHHRYQETCFKTLILFLSIQKLFFKNVAA